MDTFYLSFFAFLSIISLNVGGLLLSALLVLAISLTASILEIVGLVGASDDHSNFKRALWVVVISMVVSFFQLFLKDAGFFYNIIQAVSFALGMYVTYLIHDAVTDLVPYSYQTWEPEKFNKRLIITTVCIVLNYLTGSVAIIALVTLVFLILFFISYVKFIISAKDIL